jgi:hypothetical protein
VKALRSASIVLPVLVAGVSPAAAEVKLSGLLDLLARNRQDDVTNVTFRGTSNLNAVRGRAFLDASVSDRMDAFVQVQVDRYDDFFLYGAYVRVRDLGPVGVQAGIIPWTVGNWGPRTYSDRNPLVGVPLVWNHHTSLNPREAQDLDALLAARDERTSSGLPVLYDNCWNVGAEAYGQAGAFDWSLGILAGSATLPTREQRKDVPQGTGRVAWWVTPSIALAADGWVGPYLFDDLEAAQGVDPVDYLNAGFGGDFVATFRYLEIHSEMYRSLWEHPTLPDLWATAGYVEAKYKIVPAWYVAARAGFLEPDRVDLPAGGTAKWDHPVRRVEWGVGWSPARRVILKGVAQHVRFGGADALDRDHVMLQLSAGF